MNYELQIRPKVIDGVYYNNLFRSSSKSYFVVGNYNNGNALIVPESKISIFKNIMSELDGKNSLEKIIKDTNLKDEELIRILELLESKGFIDGAEEKNSEYNEVDKMSIKIAKISLEKLGVILKKKSKIILNVIKYIFIINVIIMFYLMINSKITLAYFFTYKGSSSLGYILITVSMVFMFVFHELGHALMATKYGAEPEYIGIVLYIFFIPMVYVKNKNLYSLQKKDYLKVLMAGVFFNLILAVIFMNVFFISSNEIFKILSISNIKLILVNLIPLSLSDGYFVFGALLGQPNLRKKSYEIISYRFNRYSRKKYRKAEYIYSVLSFLTTLVLVFSEILWFYNSVINVNQTYKIALEVISILGYLMYYVSWIDKKCCKNLERKKV